MKNLSIIFSFVIAGLVFFTISCGTSSSSPSDISKNMMNNLEKGNVDAVIDAFANSKEFTVEERNKLSALFQEEQGKIKKKGGIKTVEIIKEEINKTNDEAKVVLKVIYGNGKETTNTDNFVKENGKWKYSIKIN